MKSKNFLYFVKTARIVASCLSVAGGYILLYKFISNTITNVYASHIITSVILLFTEAGSIAFITASLNEIYQKRIKQSFVFIFSASVFLSISFFLTVNGVGEWAKKQTDKSVSISKNYKKEYVENKTYYTKQINVFQQRYDSISSLPQHKFYSVRVQRTEELKHLSERIQFFQNRLNKEESRIAEQEKGKLATNKKVSDNVSYFYFGAAIIIMFFVVLFNFLAVHLSYEKMQILNNSIAPQKDKYTKGISKATESKEFTERTDTFLNKNELISKIKLLKNEGKTGKEISYILGISQSKVSRLTKL